MLPMNSLKPAKSSQCVLEDMVPAVIGKYSRGMLLGETELGLLYSGYNTSTKEIVSIILVTDQMYNGGDDYLLKTVEYLYDKDVKGIIQYRDVVQVEGGFTFIIIDFYALGQLSDYVNMFVLFPEHIVKIIAMQFVNTLEALSNAHVIYDKLSLINTFINSKGVLQLIGLLPPSVRKSQICTPKKFVQQNRKSLINSPTTSRDSWNLGIALIELLTGRVFCGTESCAQDVIKETDFPQEVSDECKQFLMCCMDEVPMGKVSFDTLKNHPWLEDVSELHSEILMFLSEFLEKTPPYDNYKIDPEAMKPGVSFVNVCPSMKLVTDDEIKDYETISDLSLTYVILNKIVEDVCTSETFEEDQKEDLTCLVEEIQKSLQSTELKVDKKPSEISMSNFSSTLENQAKRISVIQEQVQNYAERNKVAVQEIEKIQAFLMGTKSGVELLANALYGRIGPDRLKGEKEGVLCYLHQKDDKSDKKKGKSVTEKISEKNWKKVFVILKHTFLFVFKSAEDPTLIDVFLFQQGHAKPLQDKFERKFTFGVESHIFAANDDGGMNEWTKALNNATNWYAI
ncbi:hypothetical protein EIN_376710 [Entamoeba invadens IP1]|uniref:Uncharacterized protein n=1 Tax=Entamoeba invadens IP1 TaxID=370355 RepID=A0A0A1TYA9_ENTIV|nr:hypothetical protein EIN_376710 [Entamoeba invadens IP1]ELP83486.1 hypothetical protein EIN_376710 [Entamoeba invadens IP1]|eukprot:XP_004182832.1 hypothetical protein EIN_376710 [Entamoeba invadens IP1]